MEVLLLGWVLLMATLWLLRIMFEGAWAFATGRESPRVARRRAREKLAQECGVPTVGQAIAFRVARRIANPPRRRWAVQVRGLLDELVDDALTEARVRHQHAHVQRMRAAQARQQRYARPRSPRESGWQARTGAPTPPPADVERDVIDTWPCEGECEGRHQVLSPGDLCVWCQRAATPPPPQEANPAADETEIVPPVDDETQPEETPMTQATHTINGDVRNPVAALSAAEQFRGLNLAIAAEMEILANNMRGADLGQRVLDAIAVFADECITYADSNAEQCRIYAGQVLAARDIWDDEDLRNVVDGTYLDMQGGDVVTPAPTAAGTVAISAADCRTPEAGAHLMGTIAYAYNAVKVAVEQMHSNHVQQAAPKVSVEFLGAQLDLATSIADKATDLAEVFQAHVAKLADALDPHDLRASQAGRYARAGG